ncbi:MAG: DUF1232 domain-containing protein [Myxococcales bacterium]|nr:DUF1232 domain-containing protein [Myxococcales bacterium]
MEISDLEQMIQTAVAIEAKDGHLAHYLGERAAANDVLFGEQQRREALELFEGYIRSVPKLLAAAGAASVGTPVEEIMTKVMRAAVAYWEEPEDLVPDALGVLGLLDDAYYSLRMMQLVSERLQAEAGQTLIAEDLSALDAVVRDILGTDLTDVLDDLVILSLSNAPVDELIATLGDHSGISLPPAETSFAGVSVQELVEARLSFATGPNAGAYTVGGKREGLEDALIDILDNLCGKLGERMGESGGTLEANDAILRAGVGAVEERLREALGSAHPDLSLAVSLLVGGVLERLFAGEELDVDQLANMVHFVTDGLE